MRAKAAAAFEKHRCRIAGLLPSAEIHLIGSTGVPGALTKGDLDILVRVMRAEFVRADKVLAAHYDWNRGSLRNRTFSSFKDDDANPPLGIRLTIRGGPQDDFTAFRDALLADATLLVRYNQLKRRCTGWSMSAYRRQKSKFIEQVLADASR